MPALEPLWQALAAGWPPLELPFTCGAPLALLLAPPLLALLVLWARRSLAGLATARRRLALALRAALVLLVVGALAEVRWRGLPARTEVVFVLDASRSVPAPLRREALEAVQAAAARAHPLGQSASLVAVGARAANLGRPGPGRPGPGRPELAALERAELGDGTRLEEGLALALALRDPGARARLVLLSDGNETGGDALRAVALARAAGVGVDVVPLSYRREGEVLLEKVTAPAQVDAGEAFEARVVSRAAARTRARIHLWQDGEPVGVREVTLEPGANVTRFELVAPAGLARLEAAVVRVEPARDDLPGNDVAHAAVRVRGAARLLYVAGERPSAPLLAALRRGELELTEGDPTSVPRQAAALSSYSAIVLDDLPATALSSAQLAALAAAVGDHGVGLITIGGPNAYGPGEWDGTPLAEALPVRVAPRDPSLMLDAALVLVLDRSGSMAGEKLELAKRAAAAAAGALGPQDAVGVVAFDSDAEWIVPLGRVAGRAAVAGQVARLEAGGGTVVASGLTLAGQALERRAAAVRHVILLTDGQDVAPECHALTRRMRAAGVTVTTIGIGDGAHSAELRRLSAVGGGRHYPVANPRDLPQVFVRETRRVSRPLIVERPTEVVARRGDLLLRGLEGFPPLDGYVRTEAKPQASVPLETPGGEPLLAYWTHGLGRAVAFTSDAGPRWATAWPAWSGWAALWEQAVRYVARAVDDGPFTLSAQAREDQGLLTVDAIDAEGAPLLDLVLEATVRAPDPAAAPRRVRLSPRGAGRYQAEVPLQGVGTHEVALRATGPDGRERPAGLAGLVVPYPAELSALASDEGRLEALARAGGGEVVPLWELREGRVDPWRPEGLADPRGEVEGWPALLALALGVLLLDVAVRRVQLDWARLRGAPLEAGAAGAPAARPPAPSFDLTALLAEAEQERAAAPRSPTPAPDAPPAEGGDTTRRLLDAKRRRGG